MATAAGVACHGWHSMEASMEREKGLVNALSAMGAVGRTGGWVKWVGGTGWRVDVRCRRGGWCRWMLGVGGWDMWAGGCMGAGVSGGYWEWVCNRCAAMLDSGGPKLLSSAS
jgi:hypothetical protein